MNRMANVAPVFDPVSHADPSDATSLVARWLAETSLSHPDEAPASETEAAALATLLGLTPQFIWEADADGRITHSSAFGRDYMGMSLEALRGDGWMESIAPADRERVAAAWRHALEHGTRYDVEMPIRRARDGQYRWHLVRADAVREAPAPGQSKGRIVRWVGIALDVHDMRAARTQLEAFAESEARYRHTVDLSPHVPWTADAEGRILDFHERWLTLTGLTHEAALGEGWSQAPHPDDLPAMQAAWQLAVRTGEPYDVEHRIRCADGTYRWMRSRALPRCDAQGRVLRWYGFTENIDERRRARDAIENTAEQFRLAVEAVDAGIYDWNLVTDELVWDGRCRALFGLPEGRPASYAFFLEALHPEDRVRLDARVAAVMADPHFDGVWREHYRVRRADGNGWRWIDSPGRIHFGDDGGRRRPVRFVGLVTDISEQVEAAERLDASQRALQESLAALADSEARLRESEAFARAVADAAPGILYVYDVQARRNVWGNREMTTLLGYTPEQVGAMQGRLLETLLHPDDFVRYDAHHARLLALSDQETAEFEYRMRRADGNWLWLHSREMAFRRDAAGALSQVIGTALDISERKRAEQALVEADRRKDEFLALLAHELRNPLAPIANAAKLLEHEPALTTRGQRGVEMIGRQVQQMRRLVEDLLEVSRITRGTIALKPEPLVLGSLVHGVAEAVLPAAEAKGLRLRTAVPASPVKLVADPVRIAQVLENLVGNAIKYTPEGGTIDVRLTDTPAMVELTVTDDGIGIPPDKLEQVFELFMQAEPGVGAHQGGLGIGLAMVRQLVEMHGGTVHAESAGPGRGASFVVRLPR